MKHFVTTIAALSLMWACNGGESENIPDVKLAKPSQVEVERTDRYEATVTWSDNSADETGFSIWVRPMDNLATQNKIATTAANATSYTITSGLEEGKSYYIGVRADAAKEDNSSSVEYTVFNMVSLADVPTLEITGAEASSASVVVKYTMNNTSKQGQFTAGLCWSAEGKPSIEDAHQQSPEIKDVNATVIQSIPCAALEEGKTYKVSAYLKSSGGIWYSDPVETSLAKGPDAIKLEWKEVSTTLPSEIKVYETTSTISGRAFHAWYAIADLSTGNVQLKVNVPTSAQTIDDQARNMANCLVLVNGGYFYNGRHTGVAVINSATTGSIGQVRGSLRSTSDPEWNEMYYVTRGIFGIDSNKKPSALWAGTDASGVTRYYSSPLPTVKGEAKYDALSDANPGSKVEWNPEYALSAGPLLLKDGKIPFDWTLTAKGKDYYLNNFEVMPYDIFGPGDTSDPDYPDVVGLADRTAVGYTADGKVVLFICDGRYSGSWGLDLLEEARVLKGIGCVGAVNLDGGGSTGMMVEGKHINDMTGGYNRAVVSTIGFFKK